MNLQALTLSKLKDSLPEHLLYELRQEIQKDCWIVTFCEHSMIFYCDDSQLFEQILLSDTFIRILIKYSNEFYIYGDIKKNKMDELLFVHSLKYPLTFTTVKAMIEKFQYFPRMNLKIKRSGSWQLLSVPLTKLIENYVPEKEELWTFNHQEQGMALRLPFDQKEKFYNYYLHCGIIQGKTSLDLYLSLNS